MDKKPLLKLKINNAEDITIARQRARQIAALLTFDKQKQIHIATAVSEIARNVCLYAQQGMIDYILQMPANQRNYFEIVITDQGPGIKNLPQILAGEFVSSTSNGLGILGTKRIMDKIEINSTVNQGTIFAMRMYLPASAPLITPVYLASIADALVQYRPQDATAEVQQQNQELLQALDALKQSRDELEARVAARTLDLNLLNHQLAQEIEKHIDSKNALQNVSERSSLALQAAHLGTWCWLIEEDKLQWDDAMAALFGITNRDAISCHANFLALVHQEDRARVKEEFQQAICKQQMYDIEYRLQGDTHQNRFIASRGKIDTASTERGLQMTGVCWDITERKNMEYWFHQHQLELSKAERVNAMGELASTLAHELNQPLATITAYTEGCIQRLKSERFNIPDLLVAMSATASQAERAGQIIHRMKNFMRQGILTQEWVDLHHLMREVVQLSKQEMSTFVVAIEFKPEGLLPSVQIDKIQIQQVLLNLIRNAYQALKQAHIKRPGIILNIVLEAADSVKVKVIDNGPGISKEVVPKLFDPYFTTKKSGMGIGLAICRTIIEGHGGHLFFQPNPKGGAEFHFTLPLKE